ncbi:hypothetical protein [Barthadenovirus sternae]|nr:hypothetical protein [Tern atadenovirus 1]
MLSPLFESVVFTHVTFPYCYGGNTEISKVIEANYLDVSTTCNLLGRFLNEEISTLCVIGDVNSHADFFYVDLMNILSVEIEFIEKMKSIQRIYSVNDVENMTNFLGIEFRNSDRMLYNNFSREDFAAFIKCGNWNGPNDKYKCLNYRNIACIKRRISGEFSCGICFYENINPFLRPFENINIDNYEDDDDGIVVDHLGINNDFLYNSLVFSD